MVIGIGRGDSSRRVMGHRPMTLEHLEQAVAEIRSLTSGGQWLEESSGATLHLPWAIGRQIPIWVAGYGPKSLALAGRIGDGVILQIGDPHLVKWCLSFVWRAAEEAGRDPQSIEVMSAAAGWPPDNPAKARDRVRWFPAMVSNHVVDLLKRYPKEDLPQELTAYVEDRPGYDYHEHGVPGARHARFVSDEVVERFSVLGSAEQQRAKIEQLREVGVTHFNLYLMSGDEAKTLSFYGEQILPHFR